ncbi:hypothetical protein Poly30_14220 [Planctomycetes bacterium Poly30]|uniref:Uncharacterized protein n=1 Tax=Saltatorellus ferox TaxID=2528018 RepID=A0A518EPA3_9BACT|nr:hypothetical protein Poly30_14220 [Planctomycetes bacterium Poly30]
MSWTASKTRGFTALFGLEAREARMIFCGMLEIGLLVVAGVAWWTVRSNGEVAPGWKELLGLAGLAQLALVPVLADVLSAGDERSAQRAVASLPVSSGLVLLARGAVMLVAAATLFLGFAIAWWLLAAVLPGPSASSPCDESPWDLVAAWATAGFPLLPLVSLGTTGLVALLFRHALSATVVGLASAAAFTAMLVDPGLLDRGTSLLRLDGPIHSVVYSPWTPLVLALPFWAAFRLRGGASRSWFVRGSRAALTLALCSGAAAGAAEFKEWRQLSYAFQDPLAQMNNLPWVALDGSAVVLTLRRDEAVTAWAVDLCSGEPRRASEHELESYHEESRRGFVRDRGPLVRARERVDGGWVHPVREERWTSELGGPPITVHVIHVLLPARRAPGIAYYVDADRWFHCVDLEAGTDEKTDIQIDGLPLTASVDEDGRWLTWNGEFSATPTFTAVNLETRERIQYVPGSAGERIFGHAYMASSGGGPVLRSNRDDGTVYYTIRDGSFVPMPFQRSYLLIWDIDGERMIGGGKDGGLYLIEPDGSEATVLRSPR